jgi:hypothetical protein
VAKVESVGPTPTRVEVISSTGGDLEGKGELEHLRSMAMSHFKWYEYYQNAYIALLEKHRLYNGT